MRILVVGAGFAGAVHARVLAEAGHKLTVIDRRQHIGGNCYDFIDENGVRVHAYGPHLFHTKNQRTVEWLKQWGEFVPYRHKVRALLPSGGLAPLPINLNTVNLVFGTNFKTAQDVEDHLRKVALPISEPQNAAEHLYSKIGA
jgi:UDP-galactopyranose mutase